MQPATNPTRSARSALALRERWMLLCGVLFFVLLLRLWPRAADLSLWLLLPVAALLLLAVLALSQVLLMLLARSISRRWADPTPAVAWPGLWGAALREARACLRVFAYEQALRWRDYPDSLPGGSHDSTKSPLVLIHGYVCNRGIWRRWMRELSEQRWPYASVNLEPVFGSIDAYIPLVEEAVTRAQALGDAKPWLVCHSMGGLVARAWAAATPDAEQRIAGIVTLGTPHRGTWLSRLARTPNGRQMHPDSPWLQALQQRETEQSERLSELARLSVHAQTDQIVFPPATATLATGQNWLVAGVGHVAMARDPRLLARILTWIETRRGAKAAEGV
ncbi:MAG: hypothetical protein BGO13_09715 [Burkholderiales bacterium 66-5]|nr:MAG: hypothetical protein BGO13_09715 [Burkholderiales bacterium 66-5]